jgi:hypothetical protein
METTLIYTGIACIIAAIIGGGLKAFQIEMPVFSSIKRQIALGIFGGILILAGYWPKQTSLADTSSERTEEMNKDNSFDSTHLANQQRSDETTSSINDFRDHNNKFKEFLDERIASIENLISTLNEEKNFEKFLLLIDSFNSNSKEINLELKNFQEINSKDITLFKGNNDLFASFQQQITKLDALHQKQSSIESEGNKIIKNLKSAGLQNDTESYRKYSFEWANNLLSYHTLMNQMLNLQLAILNSTKT